MQKHEAHTKFYMIDVKFKIFCRYRTFYKVNKVENDRENSVAGEGHQIYFKYKEKHYEEINTFIVQIDSHSTHLIFKIPLNIISAITLIHTQLQSLSLKSLK